MKAVLFSNVGDKFSIITSSNKQQPCHIIMPKFGHQAGYKLIGLPETVG